jgi:4-hydroxy-tetrahydrodipicolinate synthase
LTRESLGGVWVAVATPFDEDDRIDEGILRENLRRLAGVGVHGIYTTDADGEFYALELDEFRRLAEIFADETQRLGVPTQMGCTWSHTRGIVERLRIAADLGVDGAHVGHPTYMPMTPDSLRTFWHDVSAAVPESFALIHYNTPRCPNYLYGRDYAALARELPNLVGTKHVGSNFLEFMDLLDAAPVLSHFTGEHAFTPYTFFGARGVYSWFANFNPRYMLEWWDDLEHSRWKEARRRQERMHEFMTASEILHGDGNLHGIIGKALTAAGSFLIPANRTRRPYLPVPEETVEEFRRVVQERFPDLAWPGW